jgi:uncharacterized SAM-binding protein YcdF (DUF218 family)
MIRFLAISSFLLLLIFALINLGNWLSEPANKPVQADLIVALGGGARERDQMAARLYKEGYADKILITGMWIGSKAGLSYYQHPRSLFFLKQGIPAEALMFDGLAINTHQETINIAALLKAQHWHSVLVVSDPPHIQRINYCLEALFKHNALSYRLIPSDIPSWHTGRWWQEPRWLFFCVSEAIKLVYYALVYGPEFL